MLNKAKIMTFVPIRDGARARAFYEKVLGLSFVYDDPFAMVFDSNGIMLRLSKGAKFEPAGFTILGWEIPDIRKAVTALITRGVAFERFPGLEQDDLGIWRSPSGAQIAWFKDPDGNLLSLTQFPKPA
jgi:catechol 2,3-dioxygenase-like lactoylglutathione lyase family enzyme